MNTRLVEVLPWLFVSDQRSAGVAHHLVRCGIERVVTVLDKYDCMKPPPTAVEHHRFDLADMDTEDIIPVAEAIYEILKDKKRTLVHCFAGQSRSVSVIAYYLRRSGLYVTTADAFSAIEAVHGDTCPNPAFVRQITNALDYGAKGSAGSIKAGSSDSESESESESWSGCHTRRDT